MSIFNELNLNINALADASGIYNHPIFKQIVNKVISVKKDAIVDEIETKEELDKARFTLIGNKEILDIFEQCDSEFRNQQKKEIINPDEIINPV